MALDVYNLIKTVDSLRDDLTVIFTGHVEHNYDAEGVLRSSFLIPGGKLLKEKITLEGMFTIVLYTDVVVTNEEVNYYFLTQNNGKNSCKSPEGMFESLHIPNDYAYILEKIKEYES
jgi:hypothetical protein